MWYFNLFYALYFRARYRPSPPYVFDESEVALPRIPVPDWSSDSIEKRQQASRPATSMGRTRVICIVALDSASSYVDSHDSTTTPADVLTTSDTNVVGNATSVATTTEKKASASPSVEVVDSSKIAVPSRTPSTVPDTVRDLSAYPTGLSRCYYRWSRFYAPAAVQRCLRTRFSWKWGNLRKDMLPIVWQLEMDFSILDR